MDSAGTWEILCSTNPSSWRRRAEKRGQALAEVSAARERTRRRGLGRASESISEAVFGTGSLSALIVLKTPGNAAQADPVEGSGAPLLQNRS
jgi:hypothetical protein